MKKVKVQYVAGSEVREVELENVHHWDAVAHEIGPTVVKVVKFYSEDNELIAEFVNVVAVIRV